MEIKVNMLINEVREILKEYKEDELREIILKMYKSIPKKLKEEKEIDGLIKNVKQDVVVKPKIDFTLFNKEVEKFLYFAERDLYFKPNRFVPKRERSNWRLKVKSMIKVLEEVPIHSPNGDEATRLLESLYKVLSRGTKEWVFVSNEPFQAIGKEPYAFLDLIVARKLGKGLYPDAIQTSISVDQVADYKVIKNVLIKQLKTIDSKLIAIEACMNLKLDLEQKVQRYYKSKKSSDIMTEYHYSTCDKNLVHLIFKLYLSISEYEKGIQYFKKNYKEVKQEIMIYKLLSILLEYNLKDYWVREYLMAEKKIQLRDSLKKAYDYIKINNKLPEYL